MYISDKKVAIIGGGPGGLTLGVLLQQGGADVRIYERDRHRGVRVQGATLDLHEESGLEALRRAGLLDAFYAHYRPEAGVLRLMDKTGTIRYDEREQESFTDDRPEIDRGPLRDILLDALDPERIVWDSHFLNMQRSGDGWMLHFRNGTSACADLVIGADGANSKVRPALTDIRPVYSGITVVEGTIYNAGEQAPHLWDRTGGGKVFAFGDGQSLILSAKGDGSLSFYTGCRVEEHWVQNSGIDFGDRQQVFAWFREAFAGWHPLWHELFRGEEISIIQRPQYHFPTGQHWEPRGNLTLLGDAAHRMPPYAGEGVNQAMQDAYELAACLLDETRAGTRDAIGTYEAGMLQRAAEITAVTLHSTEMLHSGDPIRWMLDLFDGKAS
ncbi:MAG: FAD-dependent monooxygenase [Mucilaginibacter polytrichastri]|nr:FAD-dependent monooxygenase [Mucilaginibacter polytrichastri]